MSKKIKSLKIEFTDGSDYSAQCDMGLDYDEATIYLKKSYETPAEPLIKDKKIRLAVKAWAAANNISGASTYKSCSDAHYWYIRAFDNSERGIDINIWGELPRELTDCKFYTFEELCGEDGDD